MKFFTLAATTLMTLGTITPVYAKSQVSNPNPRILSNLQSEILAKTLEDNQELNFSKQETEYQARRFRRRGFSRRRFRRGGFHGRGVHRGRFRRSGFHGRGFRRGRFHRGKTIRIRF